MIGRLTGIISDTHRNPVIIDVHDVGFLVHIPDALAATLTPAAVNTLYIHSHIREDAFDLYGFSSEYDLNLFEYLLTVSGVGPKTALLVISRGAKSVETAVKQSDVDFFTSIPRLGKKNAQKIIIELKNKLGGLTDLDLANDPDSQTKQIKDALLSMGFDKHEVMQTLEKLDNPDGSIEDKLRTALKLLGRNA